MKRIILALFLGFAFYGWSAQITVTDNNAPLANAGPGAKNVLIMDITLSTGGVGGNLTDITFKNTGNAVSGTDISNMHFWVDGPNAGWDGDETNLGTITWDNTNSDWVISGLNQPCDGIRFFVTANITNSPTDDRTIRLQIPKLLDGGALGSFDAGDEGIFLDTGDDGPGADFLTTTIITIHSLKNGDITDNTVTNKFGPGQQNCLVFDFTIPDNDGVADTLNAITLKLNPASTINPADFSNVELWADGPSAGWDGDEANLGVGGWDGDSWVWSSLSQNIPITGQRFFATIDIVSLPASPDNAEIRSEIPQLVDSGNNGAFDTGDEGIFVASCHDGPTDGTKTVEYDDRQTLHKRVIGSLTDNTVSSEIGPGWQDKLVFDFTIPDNDGLADTLNALTLRLNLASTIPLAYLSEVRLWADVNPQGFTPSTDENLGAGTWDGVNSWEFSPLTASILSPNGRRFFVSVDVIGNPAFDDLKIVMEIPKLSDSGIIGQFDAFDEGIFVASAHEGPTDANFTAKATTTLHARFVIDISEETQEINIGAGWTNNVVLNVVLPDNDGATDTLQALTVRLNSASSAVDGDFVNLKLWRDDGDNVFSTSSDTNIKTITAPSGGVWTFSGLSSSIPPGGRRFFVTADIVNNPSGDDITIKMEIPKLSDADNDGNFDTGDLGIFVSSAHDGPIDADLTSGNVQIIHERERGEITDSTASKDIGPGWINQTVLDFTIPDNDSVADTLNALTVKLDSAATCQIGDLSNIRLWRDGINIATATLSGSLWVFSPLSAVIPIGGQKFVVTVNVVDNPSGDDKTIIMEIPRLSDGTNFGSYNPGDCGIFVASNHEGPTDGDWIPANHQTIHKRLSSDITNWTTTGASFQAGQQDCLLLDFTLPDNDGADDTLEALTIKLDGASSGTNTDFTRIELWEDDGVQVGFQGVGVDTNRGEGPWDGDSWVFYPFVGLTIPQPNGKRFFITGDIVPSPHGDNLTVKMEIPKLVDTGTTRGSYDDAVGEEGVFVQSAHDGPIDARFAPSVSHTIHNRMAGSLTDYTVFSNIGAEWQDKLVFDFTIPNNDGGADILNALTLRLAPTSTASYLDFTEVRLWKDLGAPGFQGTGIDQDLGIGTWDGDSWVFSGLSSQILSSTQRFFITVDVIANPSNDDVLVIMEIPKLYDADGDGQFDTNDEGIFVQSLHDGPTDRNFSAGTGTMIHKRVVGDITDLTAFADFGPGQKNCPVLDFVLPDNDGVADTLQALTVRLDGASSAIDADFSAVRLWKETTNIATATLNGTLWVFSGLSSTIPINGATFSITVDIINNPSVDNAIIIMEIPQLSDANHDGTWTLGDRGIFVASSHDGFVDADLTSVNVQIIHERETGDITDNTQSINIGPGFLNQKVLDFTIPDNDGANDTLNALTVRLDSLATAQIGDLSNVRLWTGLTNIATATLSGDNWVFSSLSETIPALTGKRFYVTADISDNPSGDDKTIIMEIPTLSDGTTSGSYDAGDCGIFVASKHEGPTNADFTPTKHQTIHKRLSTDITDYTASAKFGPTQKNCLLLDFKIPDNDGGVDTLRVLTARLDGSSTGTFTDFSKIELWVDGGVAGFQGLPTDTNLKEGAYDGDSWVFSGLSQTIPVGGQRFFITGDIVLDPSIDNAKIYMEIPRLVDTGTTKGSFDNGEEGIFVDSCHDGPVDADFTPTKYQTLHSRKTGSITDNTIAKEFGAGWENCKVFDFTIPDDDGLTDNLTALTLRLFATPTTAVFSDFSEIRLWKGASSLGIGTWDGDSWVFSGFSSSITGSQSFYVTVDIVDNPSFDDITVQMEIPQLVDSNNNGSFDAGDEGIFVSSSHEGPTDFNFTSGTWSIIHKRVTTDITDNTVSTDFGPGQKDCPVLDFVLPDNDGGTDILQALTVRLDGASTAINTDFSAVRLWANGQNIATATLTGGVWVFSNLSANIVGTQGFLVTVDIVNNPSVDNATIIMEIPRLSDSNHNGTYNTNDLGIFVASAHDGPVNSDLTPTNNQTIHKLISTDIVETPPLVSEFAGGWQDQVILNFVIPDADGVQDTLNALTLNFAPAATALITDFSEVRLWADNGDNNFDALNDIDLGTGTWDGKYWVWGALTQTIPALIGQRFFVTVDIVDCPSNDDRRIAMRIPRLSDGTNTGSYDPGDCGIFVFSCHEGPTNADFISANNQVIHTRKKGEFTDYTVSSEFGAGSLDRLLFDFTIPDNDGGIDILEDLTVRLAGTSTAISSDISTIRLWADGNPVSIADGLWDGNSWVFSPDYQIPSPSQRFSITGDINTNPSADNVVIILEIPKLYDADLDGNFDGDDEGIFVSSLHDGPSDGTFTSKGTHTIHCLKLANIVGTAPTRYFYAVEQDVLVMDFTITPEERDEVLNSLIIQNTGSAENGTDIQRVELWVDGATAGWNEGADETNLGIMGWNSGGTWSISGLTQQVLRTGTRFFVTIDAANSARAQRTVKMRIPINGINMESCEDGPVDRVFVNGNIQTVKGKISVNPTSGYVYDNITVSGSGFSETEDIEIDFGATTKIATTTTISAKFTKSFTVNAQTPGIVVITARGLNSGEFATTTFFLNRVVFEITKTVDKNGAEAGDFLNYIISYRNTGNISATNALLYDYFPEHTTYATHTEILGAPYPAYHDSSHIKWYLGTVLAGGDFQSATLRVKLGIPLIYGSFITNKATATADQPASYFESNEAKTMVTSLPNLVGDISVVPDTRVVFNGWRLLFTINYKNIGSATAGTTTIHIDEDKENLRDIVPSGDGIYDPNSSIIWTIGSIPPGSGGSVTFIATVFGAPGDTITVTGFIQDGFHLDLSLILSIQSEFSSEWYDWLMFHHGLGRTGYNDGTQDFYPPFGEKWRSLIGGQNDDIRSSPAILDTALYTGGLGDLPGGGWFYRLNADNGTVIWKYNTGGEIHSSPAIANNSKYVYVGNADGRFYCFSGTETFAGTDSTYIWMFDTEGGEIYSSPVVWKGLVYFTAKRQQKGYVYCLSGVDGAPAWIKPLDGQFFYSSPAISERDSLVYVGDENGVLWALDAFLGSITWSYDTGLGPISSSPVYKDGVVYIASEDGKVYALDSKGSSTFGSTTLLWSYNVDSTIKSTPALADNALFFGADDNYIYAINPPTQTGTQTGTGTLAGSLRWKYKTNGPVVSSPAVAAGVVYVGSKDGYLYGLDVKYGTLTWSYKLGNYAVSSPAIARRMLYVASGDGNVYAFERKPNFSLSKSVSPSSGINPGATLTYTLNFKNTGYVGSGVYVIDQLDANLGTPTIICMSMGSWSYSSGLLRWDVGTVSSQDYGTLTFDCQISQSAFGTITNTAVLYCNELPSISTSTKTPVNYLFLKKSVDSSYVQASGTLTYIIEYKSPFAALNGLVIEDAIPASSTYVSSSAKGEGMSILYSHNGSWDEFDNTPVSAIKWTRAGLDVGYVGTVSFKVLVDQYVDDGKIITNIAFATATTETGSLTGTSAVFSLVTSGPVIEMAKCVNGFSEATATYLSVATYTISYSTRLKNASSVSIVDKVPSGVSYISGSAMGSGTIRYSSDGVNYYLSETNPVLYIKWELGNLDKGSSGTSSFSVVVGDLDDGYIIKNYATGTSQEKGPFVSDSPLIIVSANPKLSLTKTTDQASTPGGTLTYILSYSNSRKDASGVALIDRIPDLLTYISKSATGTSNIEYGTDGTTWSVFETKPVNYIRWTIGNLNKGSSGVVSFKAQVKSGLDDGVIIENIGTMTDGEQTTTSTTRTQISSLPYLSITKRASTSTITFGETLTYTIDYQLLCKETRDIEITDKIPQDMTYDSISGDGSITYSHDNGITYNELNYLPITHVKVRRDTMQRNGTGTIRVVVELTSDLDDSTIVNVATITAKDAETKTAQTLIRISNIPKLTGSLVVSPSGPVAPGWFLTYTIFYQNTGSISAKDVVIKCDGDKNPYLTNITPLNGGVIEPNTIVWNVGTVPGGASGSVSFTAYVSSNITPSVTINVSGYIVASGTVFLALTQLSSSVFESFDSFCNAWPMFGRDPIHSHYAQDETLKPPLRIERTYDVEGGIFSSPAIGENGVIYLATDNGAINAINMDGTLSWGTQTSDSFWSSPAIAGTNTFLYIGGRNSPGYFYCFDARTGTPSWTYKTGSHIYTSPVVKYGIVYFGDDDGRVYALRATDGEAIWVYNIGHQEMGQLSSPVVENGIVYIGSKNRSIYSFDAFSGAPRWIYTTGGKITSSPALSDNILYTGSDDGYLYALMESGTQSSLLWRYNAGSSIQSSPAVAYGKVYFGAENGMVYALNQGGTSSNLSWTYQTAGRVFSSPAIANGVVYIASDDGYLYCLDANNGSFIARYYIGGGITSSPAIEKGRVFIGSAHSKLYFFVESPDLVGTKTSSVSSILPGGTITYTIAYKNNAYVGATGVEIVDSLSQDLGTPINIKGTATYYPGSHTIVWSIGTLSGKEEGSVQFDAAVRSSVAVATITNKAIIKSNEVEKETNSIDVSVLIPVLTFSKTVDKTITSSQSTITYTLLVTNAGNTDANNLIIEDFLPSTSTYSQGSTQGSAEVYYSHNGVWDKIDYPPVSGIRWLVSKLVSGGSLTVSFKVFVGSFVQDGTLITNIGSVSSKECATITSFCSTYIRTTPQLVITKIAPKTINPGATLTYTLSYTSLYSQSNNIVITDTLPQTRTAKYIPGSIQGLGSITYSHDNGATYNENDAYPITHIKLIIPTLLANQTGTASFSLMTEQNLIEGTLIENNVIITGSNADPGSSSIITVVQRVPILQLTKEVSPAHTTPGQILTYKLTYQTLYKDAENVIIEDEIPGSLTYSQGSARGQNAVIRYYYNNKWYDVDSPDTRRIRWMISYLTKDTLGTASFEAKALETLLDKTIIENIATMTASNTQAKATATCSVFILSMPILTIEKAIDMKNSYPYPGGTLTYVINFSNELKQATNVTIIDTLPQETTYSTDSTTYAQGAIAWYSHDNGSNYDQNPINPITHIKWIIAKLDPGKKGSITSKVKIKSEIKDGTIVTNRVSIKSDEVSTSTKEASIYIVSKPDLSQSTISMTPTGTVSEGWFIKYETEYKNTGNQSANGVLIKVGLSKYLTNITIGEDGTISNGIITWNIGTVNVGGEGKRTFSAYVKKPILSQDTIVVSATFIGSNVDPVVKSVVSTLVPPINSEKDEWPMLGFNPSHSGYNPKEFIMTQKLGLIGSVSPSFQIFAPCVINNNRVYVSCKGSGALYSFDKDGKELWKYPARVYSTPAIADNKIFFTDEDGYLHCLNEQGSPIFSKLYIGLGLSSPAIVNGIVYITSSRAIFAISAFDGSILWSYTNINGNIYSSPAISDGSLYIGTDEGNVYFIDEYTGELKASTKVSGRIYSSLAIDEGIAYFGARDGKIYGIKQYGTGTTEVLNLNLGSAIDCIPAIYNDTIYIGADNGRLYAIDISGSGTIKWEFPTGGRIKSQCALANTLFFTSEDGYLYSLNLDNGEMLFTYKIGNGRGVSLANGRVYAVSDNKLWIFGQAPNLFAAISYEPYASAGFVTCGGTITYRIGYENKGQTSAIDTKVTAYLDNNLQTPFDISNGGTYSEITRTITWNLGTISESASGILTFRCQTYASRTTKIMVYGEISAKNNPSYKTNIVENTVGDPAHLTLTIIPFIATATLNEIITYNLQYLNSGDFPAYSVGIVANKPDWTTYIQNSTRHNGTPLSDVNGQSPLFSGISMTRLEGLAGGSITFNLKVNIDCPNGTILNTSGTISGQGILSTKTSFVLIEAPCLSGSESVSPSLVRPGNSVIYTISYENRGSRSAYNLIITEKISQDLATVTSISKNGNYNPLYHMITWILGELKPGEVSSITFNAQPKSVLNNGLVVRNNVYLEATNILRFEIPQATLTIESGPNLTHSTKDVNPKAGVSLGSVVRYDINVSNTGNMDAEGVMVYDRLPPSISVSQLKTKGEVVSGDSFLDIDDINGWSGFDNGGVDGTIQITTNQGIYTSSPINTFNYPSIKSLITEINNDNKAGSKISYDSDFDRFTILAPVGGCIMALSESGTYPFFSAIKIETGAYCTGTYTNGVISWNLGKISGYSSKAISFSAQVVDNGQIINYATITSANHSTVTTNMAEITVDKNPPTLIGRPKEDSSDLGVDYDFLDDDADIDGVYRVVFPVESEPCGLIEYEIAERMGTGSWVIIGTPSSTASFYEVSTRTKGLTYTYRVRARNVADWGNWSNPSDGIKIVDGAKVVLPINETDVLFSENLLLKIPKGAFSSTITFTIQRKDVEIMVASPGISSILPNSVYEFLAIPEEYSEGGTQPLKPLTLILPYNDLDEANETDDLSYRIYKLIGAQLVLVDGLQIVDPAKNTVQCTLNSLSIYCVGSPVGLSLSNVIIQPNPFKANKHDKIQFFGLTNGRVDISIFNIAGELILKRKVPGPLWDWNLLNDKGNKVSSGIYIAVIDDGKEKVIRRFAIIK